MEDQEQSYLQKMKRRHKKMMLLLQMNKMRKHNHSSPLRMSLSTSHLRTLHMLINRLLVSNLLPDLHEEFQRQITWVTDWKMASPKPSVNCVIYVQVKNEINLTEMQPQFVEEQQTSYN